MRSLVVLLRGPVPVPTRGAPFDVDLGPGVREEVVAVYSRCRRESGGLGVYATLVEPWRGCDLYRATLSGEERRIAGRSAARGRAASTSTAAGSASRGPTRGAARRRPSTCGSTTSTARRARWSTSSPAAG
jgi:hypothetical protein